MKNKTKKLFSTLLAIMMLFALFVPISASAADGSDLIKIVAQSSDATYKLNENAKIELSFAYKKVDGYVIKGGTPITVRLYWSSSNNTSDRSHQINDPVIFNPPHDEKTYPIMSYNPDTSVVGVTYYFAVISFEAQAIGSTASLSATLPSTTEEVVCKPVKITVTDDSDGFKVKKVDVTGKPLAGAVIQLTPDSSVRQDSTVTSHEATSDKDGYVTFSVPDGQYILSEKQAPAGYNATDEKFNILVNADGVHITGYSQFTFTDPMALTIFVNKEIPQLNKEDHFAYMQGYPEGTFLPERNMTRAEAVVMFSRLLAKSMDLTTDYRNNYYPDVAGTAWYANQVGYMQTLGVLADYSRDGKFRPDDPVTRAEFATLAAHFDSLILTDTNKFPDVPSTHWAVKYINSAAAKGWITGFPDGSFKPEDKITRAQVVTLVNNMLERAADKDYLTAHTGTLPRSYSDVLGHWAYERIMEASLGHDYEKVSSGETWTSTYK